MKTKTVKLELDADQQITLTAPAGTMNYFLLELSNMAHFAAEHAERYDYYNMQEFYERFSKEMEILALED